MIVFVYGTLRKGQGNHYLMQGAEFLGEARTTPHWKMVSLGPFPGVIPGSGSIVGELFKVDPPAMARLDRLEGAPRFYHRKSVTLTDGRSAIMYVLTHAGRYADHEPITSGDWCDPQYAASGPCERG